MSTDTTDKRVALANEIERLLAVVRPQLDMIETLRDELRKLNKRRAA